MTHEFAPRISRVISWARTSLMVLALAVVPALTFGQANDTAKAVDKGKDKPAEAEATAAEVFIDGDSKKALTIFEPMTFVGSKVTQADKSKIIGMATGQENIDPGFLKNYIDFFAVELSTRANINAVIKPPANLNQETARAMERAVNALTDPMIRARGIINKDNGQAKASATSFLAAYSRALFESRLVKLLDNNLISRIDAMIVLGMAGSKDLPALDLYVAQIKSPSQVIWVKSWAARGITKAAQEGQVAIETSRAIQAAKALIDLLEDDKLPYPVQIRAIECLGSIRLATARLADAKLDVASVVMKFLADPSVKLEVRAYAAWSLGMMKVPSQTNPYNFMLLGHEVGKLATEIAEAIVEEYDDAAGFDPVKKQIANPLGFEQDKDAASRLTSLLLFQVMPCLNGQEGVNDSGLLKSNHTSLAGMSKQFVGELEKKTRTVTVEAYELLRAGGNAQLTRRNSLDEKIGEMNDFLTKNPARDRTLMPGGPIFPEVAGAPR